MFFDPFIAGAVGLSFLEGVTGASSERDQARRNMDSIMGEMGHLRDEKSSLRREYTNRQERVTDKYGLQVDSLLDKMNRSMIASGDTADEARRRTGFSKSGTVDRKVRLEETGLRKDAGIARQSLGQDFRGSMHDLAFEERKDQSQIDAEMRRLEAEYETQKAASEEKFLGIF
jgi:phage host-nuclease inhibitor protein Gam